MTSSDVQSIVEGEIGTKWDQSNAHGVNLRKCLVTPEKKEYVDSFRGGTITLWLVLEEDPREQKGYKIVFDETTSTFGLATTQMNGPDVFIGFHGSFMGTLESM